MSEATNTQGAAETIRRRPGNPGFALVATLSLLILLAILAVGLMTLSSVAVRSSGHGSAQALARANARMALMVAIGELQTYTGADTRVTAPADLLDPAAPPLTGVWKSWEGTDHDATGRPIRPDYDSKKPETSGGRFVTWLVSGAMANGVPTSLKPAELVSETSLPGTVPLLGRGTLGDNEGQIHVKPQPVNGAPGAMAWWVSPENQKARLSQPHKPRTDDLAGWVEMGQSHLVPNPSAFGLDALLDDPDDYKSDPDRPRAAGRAITLATTEFIANGNAAEPQHNFHALSTSATGLLTNTATGGWRKDMSILTEKWDTIYAGYPGAKLPLFRYLPQAGKTSLVPKPVKPNATVKASDSAALSAATPPQSNLYPWSNYSLILGYTQPGTYHAAAASWESLKSFATAYRNFSSTSGEVRSPFIWDKIAKPADPNNPGKYRVLASEVYNHKHNQRLHPQIARFQFLVYAKAEEDPRFPTAVPGQKRYLVNIMYVPVFTLWNPYNVSIQHTISGTLNAGQGSGKHPNFLGFGWRRSPPGVMAILNKAAFPEADNVATNQYKLFTPGNFQTLDWPDNNANLYDNGLPQNTPKYNSGNNSRWIDKRTFACWLPEGTISFKPGEVKIYSPGTIDPAYGFSGVIRLKEGYSPAAIEGVEFWNRNHATNPVAGLVTPTGTPGGILRNDQYVWFLFRPDRVSQPYRDREPGNGFSLSFGDGSDHFGTGGTMPTGIGDEFHNITSLTAESEADAYWKPDEVDEVGYTVSELASGPWIPVFSVTFGPRMTLGTAPGTNQNRPTKGTVQNDALVSMVLSDPKRDASQKMTKDHPANNTFDLAYHSLSIGSTLTPNLSKSEGYIATGYQSGDGISRLVMVEIPLRPMASLLELNGWNPRGTNPYPPFQMNLIGNSDATPMIPKDEIAPATLSPNSVSTNLMHDDAYCANHLLFDDWFVSSIAPQPQVLGGNIAKDIEAKYRDFLTKREPLSNRSYQPIAADTNLSDAQVTDLIQKLIRNPDGWMKAASRLEVDGMFNVNSTSVDAWKAILGHAKSREEIAMHGKDGMDSAPLYKKHAVSRGAVASDVEAGSGPAIGGQAEKASEYAGFRSLSDKQIEDLAGKIVEQVRLRGPFLSLSEFVNRQLSPNEDLALAGAVQTAINKLEDDPMKVLRDPKNSLSDNTMPANDPKVKEAKYEFAKAAEGSSAYGAPGWIRQADVLRPIAPILSARDDTFTIRTYGDARDASGNVIAKAWCEAVVKRTRDFCDQTDAADTAEPPVAAANVRFGRRYQIVTFRWLSPDEV